MKKEVKKQVKKLCKQAEKVLRDFGGEESTEYDTNVVLIRMDKLEEELNALRDAVNREKKQQYLDRIGRTGQAPSDELIKEGKYIIRRSAQ